MLTVPSADGTPIAVWRSGRGPALLLVHGTTADHTTTWRLVLAHLERHFTVYAMDRRGRGQSGDAAVYELEREAEDVAAVVAKIGEPVSVLGHSFGGLVALEAALLAPNLRRLILYEAISPRGAERYAAELVDRLGALLAAGEAEGVLVTLLREVVAMPPAEIELLRSQREAWSVRVANARTVPRELRVVRQYVFDPTRYRGMRIPTLLLVGGDSPAHELEDAQAVAAALPDARVRVLPRQQHIAMHTAPELFVDAVTALLT